MAKPNSVNEQIAESHFRSDRTIVRVITTEKYDENDLLQSSWPRLSDDTKELLDTLSELNISLDSEIKELINPKLEHLQRNLTELVLGVR